jgi:hypothetical protein
MRPAAGGCIDSAMIRALLGAQLREICRGGVHANQTTRLVVFSGSPVPRSCFRAPAAQQSRRVDTFATQATPSDSASPSAAYTHLIINFYHLVPITKPETLAQHHKQFIRENDWDIRGRIYMSFQGINAQFSGPKDEAVAYTEWVAAQSEFEGMQWRSYPVWKNMFPRLRLKFRPNLISLQGGMKDLPVVGALLTSETERHGGAQIFFEVRRSWSTCRGRSMERALGEAARAQPLQAQQGSEMYANAPKIGGCGSFCR